MEACRVILGNKELIYAGAAIGYSLLEFWLGKTTKVQSASAIELILSPLFKRKSLEDK